MEGAPCAILFLGQRLRKGPLLTTIGHLSKPFLFTFDLRSGLRPWLAYDLGPISFGFGFGFGRGLGFGLGFGFGFGLGFGFCLDFGL